MPEHDKTRKHPAGRIPTAGPGTILMAIALVAGSFFLAPGSSTRLFAASPQEAKKAPPAGKIIKLKARVPQVKAVKKESPQKEKMFSQGIVPNLISQRFSEIPGIR